jgi:hypothetical protein
MAKVMSKSELIQKIADQVSSRRRTGKSAAKSLRTV